MNDKTYPILYKKTHRGSIEQWVIAVTDNTITVQHGLVGGKQQVTSDTIKEGKNLGKVSETTPAQQAMKEADAKFLKQLKKGYNESLEQASQGLVNTDVILGGFPPMLSINKSHPKDPILKKYLKYPCLVQPKLDGGCCIAIVEDGTATIWSRTRKPVNCLPHIIKDLEARFPKGKIILHGEGYNHEYHDRFEELMSIFRKNEPDPDGIYLDFQFHVYDIPYANIPNFRQIDKICPYEQRYNAYMELLNPQNSAMGGRNSIIPVTGYYCQDLKELLDRYDAFLEDNYEGGMAKNLHGLYEEGKRSYNILKMKEWIYDECVIVDIEEGRSKDLGTASKVWCRFPIDNGKRFKVSLKMSYPKKQEIYQNKEKYIGMILTYRYKRLTADGVPYIANGLGFSFDKQKESNEVT